MRATRCAGACASLHMCLYRSERRVSALAHLGHVTVLDHMCTLGGADFVGEAVILSFLADPCAGCQTTWRDQLRADKGRWERSGDKEKARANAPISR